MAIHHNFGTNGAEKTFWRWYVTLALGFVSVISAQAFLFWINHRERLNELPDWVTDRLFIFLGIATLSFLPLIGIVLRYIFTRFVLPLQQITEEIEAVRHGAPIEALKLEEGSVEMERLLVNIRNLIQNAHLTEDATQNHLNQALERLNREKLRLESVLEVLRRGVIVCDGEGIVRRYNRAARQMLGGSHYLGKGRSLYRVIDKALCDWANDTIHSQREQKVAHPFVRFDLPQGDGPPLHARVMPLLGEADTSLGFVVTLDSPSDEGIHIDPKQIPNGKLPPLQQVIHPDTPLADLRYVVFDTETTGLNPSDGDEIISIGATVIVDGEIEHEEIFDELVDPQRELTPASIRVHGITPDQLVGKPSIAEVIPHFSRFAEGAVLVAHNAAFDMRFLQLKEKVLGVRFDQPVLDTMLLSSVLHPSQNSHSLDSLTTRYGITVSGRHTALGDAMMTGKLLLKLLPQLEQMGIITLEQALKVSKTSPLARITF